MVRLVRLYNRYKDDEATFVSMSVDDREDKQALETARQFLRRQNAVLATLVVSQNATSRDSAHFYGSGETERSRRNHVAQRVISATDTRTPTR